jgi:hypothetical protein
MCDALQLDEAGDVVGVEDLVDRFLAGDAGRSRSTSSSLRAT